MKSLFGSSETDGSVSKSVAAPWSIENGLVLIRFFHVCLRVSRQTHCLAYSRPCYVDKEHSVREQRLCPRCMPLSSCSRTVYTLNGFVRPLVAGAASPHLLSAKPSFLYPHTPHNRHLGDLESQPPWTQSPTSLVSVSPGGSAPKPKLSPQMHPSQTPPSPRPKGKLQTTISMLSWTLRTVKLARKGKAKESR